MSRNRSSPIKTKDERERYFKSLKTPDSNIEDTLNQDIDRELTSYTEIDNTEVESYNVARTPFINKAVYALTNNIYQALLVTILGVLLTFFITSLSKNIIEVERVKSDLYYLRGTVEKIEDKYANADGRLNDIRIDIEILKIEIERDLSEIKSKIDNLINE